MYILFHLMYTKFSTFHVNCDIKFYLMVVMLIVKDIFFSVNNDFNVLESASGKFNFKHAAA